MVAWAIVGSAAIGAAGTAYASNQAANAQKDAANKAANTQLHMFDVTQQNLQPYNQFGTSMLPSLRNLLTGSPSQIENQLQSLPGYQFDLTQGLKATQNSAAARGLGVSGAALKGAASYATGLADSTYGNQVNRLQNAAGLGENAAAGVGQAALQTGANVGNSYTQAGNAAASGIMGMSNAFSNGLQSIPAAMMWNSMYGNGGGMGAQYTPESSFTGPAGSTMVNGVYVPAG